MLMDNRTFLDRLVRKTTKVASSSSIKLTLTNLLGNLLDQTVLGRDQ